MTSNFELKPLKLTVFEATDADWGEVTEPPRRKNQRSPADFKVKAIKVDRELRQDSSYRSEFTNVPLTLSELEVVLTAGKPRRSIGFAPPANTARPTRRCCATCFSPGGSRTSCRARSMPDPADERFSITFPSAHVKRNGRQ